MIIFYEKEKISKIFYREDKIFKKFCKTQNFENFLKKKNEF